MHGAFQVRLVVKNAYNAGDAGSVPGWGRSPSLQYSCLENPMDRTCPGACRESDVTEHTHTHTHRQKEKERNRLNSSPKRQVLAEWTNNMIQLSAAY